MAQAGDWLMSPGSAQELLKPITPWKGSWAELLPKQRVAMIAHIAHDKSNLTALITRVLTKDNPDT